MIDIHSHILPGLDDGSKSLEETLEIVRQLQKAGFETILTTPHVIEGTDYLHPDEILASVEQVRQAVIESGIPVQILPGAENYIFPEMAKWVREGKLLTLGNTKRYILVELPLMEIPRYTDQVFFDLNVEGLTPVLAHPERYREIIAEPERLIEWAKRGILFQIDFRSLSGRYGPQVKKLTERMLSSGLIHFIGSDAHRVSHSESDAETLQSLRQIIGEEKFEEVTVRNPQCILEGKEIRVNEEYVLKNVDIKKKKRGISRFFKI
ncbi:tyrosine-protein phosphatase YwqE [Desulfosporosinus acididurans]|uniref:protein-tyrosine-phosphatase n=1 Tax=Desulfosporosinus acididurans TaxID=476652 RepID=A0A0J1FT38_9FIRM|nr:CpsB/CapC family capsule biosynthesis tyrosine phosphatase [Desulfosporosinus acididurans]KLU66133.1 tyrosine-protein phosphatase YwqE [Desulfosporosinus acididurans]